MYRITRGVDAAAEAAVSAWSTPTPSFRENVMHATASGGVLSNSHLRPRDGVASVAWQLGPDSRSKDQKVPAIVRSCCCTVVWVQSDRASGPECGVET